MRACAAEAVGLSYRVDTINRQAVEVSMFGDRLLSAVMTV